MDRKHKPPFSGNTIFRGFNRNDAVEVLRNDAIFDAMTDNPVLRFTDRGIYCADGDFYIDPWKPVDRAVVTHAHADHARPGHNRYLCTPGTLPVLRHRLGDISADTADYGQSIRLGSATVSLHPAGHVPGSAQVRIETSAGVWVVSGDYKVEDDGLSTPFEPVRCDTFISECTFGLPLFRWRPQTDLAEELNRWWATNAADGKFSLLGAYSLGKAQRLLSLADPSIAPILTHGAIEGTNAVLRTQGLKLPDTVQVTPETRAADYPRALVIAPPAALGSTWAKRFRPCSDAFASGWMAVRGIRRRYAADRGFVISDHADWAGLNASIKATGAEQIFVTHGYTASFRKWLEQNGYDAQIVTTEFAGDMDAPE